MATGDQFDIIRAGDFSRESGPPQEPSKIPCGAVGSPATAAGVVSIEGVPLFKQDTQGYQFVTRVWNNGTPLSVGLTFSLYLCDDPNNPSGGLVVRIGIIVKRIVSGTNTYDLQETSAAAEQFFTNTMPAASTPPIVSKKDCAIVLANLPASLAAGDEILVRIRRNGSNAADTHLGTVLLSMVRVGDS